MSQHVTLYIHANNDHAVLQRILLAFSRRRLRILALQMFDLRAEQPAELQIDLGHVLVRDRLDLGFGAAFLILADHLLLEEFLDVVHRIPTNIANCDTPALGLVAHDPDHVLAALLGQWRQRYADDRARR